MSCGHVATHSHGRDYLRRCVTARAHMPGKRNLARERAQHAATEHERSAALYTMLCQALPDREQAIIGHARILHHLASLHVTRRNGRPLSWRIVTRWRRLHAFPLLSGAYRPHHLAPPFSTTHAITAYLLVSLCLALSRCVSSNARRASPTPHDRITVNYGKLR